MLESEAQAVAAMFLFSQTSTSVAKIMLHCKESECLAEKLIKFVGIHYKLQ
jgi:hypothetical protein